MDPRLNKRLKDTPIAIVGMASLFAHSRYLDQFWDLISDQIDGITDVPASHWQAQDYFDANKSTPDKTYCKRGGFLPEVDFNPMEFGLPPNLLELTDTSQLLSLLVAKDVLADAGITDNTDKNNIGITLGVGGGQKISHSLATRLQYPVLKKVFKESGITDNDSEMLIKKFQDQYVHWEENSFPGSLGNVIAGRIANRFDLGGMNCVVDAACAGSLAAMRMAISELVDGRSDMMITGGVCTDNSPYMYMSFSKTPAFTTQEVIQPFDIDSKGMMIGEGIGMVALKRLEDAERDGDRIYSVIKGVGSSSDGKFKSIYAPRPEGQAKALKRAYDDAGFAPHTLGLIEAHGTGTAAGDVAEFNGLKSVFSEGCDKKQHIALGSVKSQIGHTKSTAGTAGLIKAALALHHKVLPATINVSQPNPKLNIEDSPFYLNTQTRPWLPRIDGTPRRAGISSFGFGGTNFHFVLEEYQPEHQRPQQTEASNASPIPNGYRQRQVAQTFLFSQTTLAALLSQLTQVLTEAKRTDEPINLIAQTYPLRALVPTAPRIGFVANNTQELIVKLNFAINELNQNKAAHWTLANGTSFRAEALIHSNNNATGPDAKVAALFAGQGSQYVNMGIELGCHFPEIRTQFSLADQVFARHLGETVSEQVYPQPVFNKHDEKAQAVNLTQTRYAQSAIGALSMGQYELFTQAGFHADMVAGHSFGELTALCAAGVIKQEDYYQLAFARGQAMSQVPDGTDAGGMAAVMTSQADDLEKIQHCLDNIKGVKIANYNSPTQFVIAGENQALTLASNELKSLGLKVISLPVSGAFHTSLVAHAQTPFAKAIDKVSFTKPKRTLYSNSTAKAYANNANSIKAGFKQHMLQSVHFSQQIEAMYHAGARIFVEFGPKSTLQKLILDTLNDKQDELCVVSINPKASFNHQQNSDQQLRQAALEIAVAGVTLTTLDPYQAATRLPEKLTPMTIKLSATNHISQVTKNKMVSSLASGKISPVIQDKIIEKEKIVEVEKVIEKVVEVEKAVESIAQNSIETKTAIHSPVHTSTVTQTVTPQINITPQPENPSAVSNDNSALSQFFAAQQQTAQLHQEFLNIPQQYNDTVTHMMVEQTKIVNAGITIPTALEKSMSQFHQHQADTLKSHAQYLTLQNQSNHAVLALLEQTKSEHSTQIPTVLQPIEAGQLESKHHQAAATDLTHAAQAQTSTVTIPQESIPSTKHTPRQTQTTPVSTPNKSAKSLATQSRPQQALQSNNIEINLIKTSMLSVVSEKTGYPTDMLNLDMDMEADLGIDSIKRVEILASVQDKLPNLPELSPDDLSECRTLGDIVTYLNSQSSDNQNPEPQHLGSQDLGHQNLNTHYTNNQSSSIDSRQAVAPHASNTISANNQNIQTCMLSVVSEKTGYPTDMLNLDMDMEADLGIDSIKRVEILASVQDKLPNLPELNPDDLSECRTLGDIVTYLNSQSLSIDSHQAVAPHASNTISANNQNIQTCMLSVVSEKTGYPTDMLNLDMDMEADLGIDSIKRVEILASVQDKLPNLPELNPDDLSECRTLGDIVTYLNCQSINGQNPSTDNGLQVIKDVAVSNSNIQTCMLSVVSEKTGYPTDMLNLDMDMEADLGIDSIKRVEILASVQDKLPNLPELNPDDLSECRTLGDIVTYLNSQNPDVQDSDNQGLNNQSPDNLSLNGQSPSTDHGLQVTQSVTVSNLNIQVCMLSVVSEKTGYPVDMLNLDMDMEADLGIDSIKRVEILASVQDQLPNLPELNPDDLSECRTLGDIVNYLNSQSSDPQDLDNQSLNSQSPDNLSLNGQSPSTDNGLQVIKSVTVSNSDIQTCMLSVVSEKTGYPVDMLNLEMDMEADLGIDSIKRVEILASVQDQLPNLPELNPDELNECRSLGEITAYLNTSTKNSNIDTHTAKSAAINVTQLPPHSEISLKKQPAAAKPTALSHAAAYGNKACMIIVDDGHNAGVLAEKMTQAGLDVAVMLLPEGYAQSPLNAATKSIQVAELDETSITSALKHLLEQVDAIAGIIHLQPQSLSVQEVIHNPLNLDDTSLLHIKHAFLWAKVLQPHLDIAKHNANKNNADKHNSTALRRSFISVSRIDGGFGYMNAKHIQDAELNQGALAGLTKTLSHEWPMTRCKALDICPQLDASAMSTAILNELFNPNEHEIEIGINAQARYQLIPESPLKTSTQDISQASISPSKVTRTDKILVTGGAKGVTLECALRLAKSTQAHFILAGRSEHLSLNQRPEWAKNQPLSGLKTAAINYELSQGKTPTPKQIETLIWPIQSSLMIDEALAAFEQVGASAEYLSMDVSDKTSVISSLENIVSITEITGLIHGAGVLADQHIQHKTLDEFSRVYHTKVAGLQSLLTILDVSKLKLVALFSSAAGFYGNEGQSDYAMANEILNKAALQLHYKHSHTKVMSFNWGPWDGGMVSPALKKMFTERGVYVIPVEAGAKLFTQVLTHEHNIAPHSVQLLIGNSMQGRNQENQATSSQTQGTASKKRNASDVSLSQHSRTLETPAMLDIQALFSHSEKLTFTQEFKLADMPFIEDHCIAGHPVLPTVCAIQWMKQTAIDILNKHAGSKAILTNMQVIVKDYKLLKGVIFDRVDCKTLTLSFSTDADNALMAVIHCDAIPQYSARLMVQTFATVNQTDPCINALTDTLSTEIANFTAISGNTLYRNASLFHGPRLQGIDRIIYFNDTCLLASCLLPTVLKEDCGLFAPSTKQGESQPFAEDCLLQAMLIWARLKYDAASLPSSIGELTTYSPLMAGEQGTIKLDVIKSTKRTLLANVVLYHQDGQISAVMKSAKITISKNLNAAFSAHSNTAHVLTTKEPSRDLSQ